MKRLVLILLIWCIASKIFAQSTIESFSAWEEVKLSRGSIWSRPTSKSTAIAHDDHGQESLYLGCIHDRTLTVVPDSIVNNYVKVVYYEGNEQDSTGWIYVPNLERKPIPHMLPQDTLLLIKYLENCEWKKYNDSQKYSKYVHAEVYKELANVHYRARLFMKAVYEYSNAIALNPRIYTRVKRAFAKYELGDYTGAIHDLNAVTATDPKNWTSISGTFFVGQTLEFSEVSILNTNGYCKLKLNRFADAAIDFIRSLTFSKENSEAYYYRAFCYLNQNNRLKACSDFSKAGEQGSAEAYSEIAKYCNR